MAPDVEVTVTADCDVIANADRVIFPGVGAIRDCMAEIRRLGFDKAVADVMASGKPLLAICVGMQALMASSEENDGVKCLDIFGGTVKFFGSDADFKAASAQTKLKVPHMGWNQVEQVQDHPLWQGIDNLARFYFVHSFFVEQKDPALAFGKTEYGHTFTSAIAKDNLFAAQFHPEKSHDNGLALLKNFVAWDGKA